jgi:phosphatidate cytidylyltransferase
MAAPSVRAHVIVGFTLGAAALATLLAGRVALSAFLAVVVVAAYVDLRRLLAPWGHIVTTGLGAIGTAGFLWAGYSGRLELLAGNGAALVLALLVTRVLLHEISDRATGTTEDIAATLAASATAGVLGAHVLLIRSVPRLGFRALLAFGLMVIGNDVVAFFVGRMRGRRRLAPRLSPSKTWAGAVAGFATSVGVGILAGFVWDPPFDLRSGLALGSAMGVLAIVGDLVFSGVKRSAGAKASNSYLGALGGALDAIDGVLFAAPAFYWALRTLAL